MSLMWSILLACNDTLSNCLLTVNLFLPLSTFFHAPEGGFSASFVGIAADFAGCPVDQAKLVKAGLLGCRHGRLRV